MGGSPVQALTVMTLQDRTVSPFSDGEIDCAGGARHERDQGGLVVLAHDAQHSVATLERHVLDAGSARFAHSQPVQPE